MNEKTPENSEESPENSKNRDLIGELEKRLKNLIEKIRQQEQKKQNSIKENITNNINNNNNNNNTNLQRMEYFKYHSFTALSKIKNMLLYKEWLGETKNDEIVIISYKNGELRVGAGWSEIKARQNMELVCETRDINGVLVYHNNITINHINEIMQLEWKIPDDYIDE